MPELPEVQTVVDELQSCGILGARISGARIFWPQMIARPAGRAFCQRIRGRLINDIGRRGKFIVLRLDRADHLLIHLRMSGRLHLVDSAHPRSKHEHVVLQLGKSRQLRLHDTRKFARLYLLADPAIVLGRLGPEPLGPLFTARALGNILHSRRRQLKPLLLDQNIIAGLGNIYTDEALWEARIHPCRKASSLSELETKALHRAIRKVLRQGLRNSGTTLGNGKSNFRSVAKKRGQNQDQLNIFRRTNLPCPRCKTPVKRLLVAQRSTHICPNCQS